MNEQAAGEALGEEVLAGSPVMPKGFGVAVGIAAAGPVVGGAAGVVAAGKILEKRGTPTTPGGHQGWMYVAVGPTQVAFFEMKRGLFRSSLGKTLAQIPRTSVAKCDFQPARLGGSPFQIELEDGTVYPFEVARVHRGQGDKVHALLRTERESAKS